MTVTGDQFRPTSSQVENPAIQVGYRQPRQPAGTEEIKHQSCADIACTRCIISFCGPGTVQSVLDSQAHQC